ncbi:hypothetical protein [Brevundimonas sp. Root1279]|uniref:hypothetical protein n=1 Tax=Brevundimonas sp. Root1279 TaxID=1736443 RepID=UPI0006FB996D|nr:hypothetical protein [Brevundimonas sp. Root1279]KQW82237.1 hypothetical protein ASC65_08130 [Brevundimonas sp. Root1279]
MSENQDRAERILAWAGGKSDNAVAIVDACDEALSARKQTPEDPIGAQRTLRAVVAFMAATKAITAFVLADVKARERRCAPPPQQEDEMDHRDDSPETLERLRDELESRLRRLRSVLESKGLDGEPRPWPPARAAGEPV